MAVTSSRIWLAALAAALLLASASRAADLGRPEEEGVASSCDASEPCCFADLHRLAPPSLPGSQRTADYGGGDGSPEPPPVALSPPSWMRTCLGALKVNAAHAQAVSELVSKGYRDHHATAPFTGLQGAAEAPYELHPGLPTGRDSLEAEVRRAMDASRLPDGSHSAWDLHFGLAGAVGRLFDSRAHYLTPFLDLSLYRVATLWPALDNDGRQVFLLTAAPEWDGYSDSAKETSGGWEGVLDEVIYQAVHGEAPPDPLDFHGLVVTHVNGVPAEGWMARRADSMGALLSPGARLNYLLADEGPEPLYTAPPPETDQEEFRFTDGSTVKWKLTVVKEDGDHEGLQDLQGDDTNSAHYNEASYYFEKLAALRAEVFGPFSCGDDHLESSSGAEATSNSTAARLKLRQWADLVTEILGPGLQIAVDWQHRFARSVPGEEATEGAEGGRTRGRRDEPMDGDGYGGGAYGAGPMMYDGAEADGYYGDYNGEDFPEGGRTCGGGDGYYSDYEEVDYTDTKVREVEPGVWQVASYSDGWGEPFAAVYHLQRQGVVVLKLRGFAVGSGPWAGNGGLMRALHAAVTAAEAYARPKGLGDLLIDVAANAAGGDSAAAFFLLALLQQQWRTPAQLCDLCTLRVSPLGNFLSSAAPGEVLKAQLRQTLGADTRAAALSIISLVEEVQGRVRSVAATWGEAAFDLADLDIVSEQTEWLRSQLSDAASDNGAVITATESYVDEVTSRLLVAAAGRSMGSVDGALKYDPGTAQELKGLDWHTHGRQERWGANFTQHFHSGDCHRALQLLPDTIGDLDVQVHAFSKVIVVTDGVCVGACSLFAVRMAASGSAGTVTFGGLRSREPGGTTLAGSPGPPAEEYDAWAADTVLAFFASALLGNLPCRDGSSHPAVTDAPVPPPAGGFVRFGLAAHQEPYLGPSALPHELYHITADAHVWMWPRFPGVCPGADFVAGGGEGAGPEGWEIVQVWKEASREFENAPLLSERAEQPQWDHDSAHNGGGRVFHVAADGGRAGARDEL